MITFYSRRAQYEKPKCLTFPSYFSLFFRARESGRERRRDVVLSFSFVLFLPSSASDVDRGDSSGLYSHGHRPGAKTTPTLPHDGAMEKPSLRHLSHATTSRTLRLTAEASDALGRTTKGTDRALVLCFTRATHIFTSTHKQNSS